MNPNENRIKRTWPDEAVGKKAAQENRKAMPLNENELQQVAGGQTRERVLCDTFCGRANRCANCPFA